ncbi:MAG: hypothetical protein O3B24_01840 [Verrucomicrobia bacterium]|nr:hypothetical protein [Verrucomicrobiota bacterium]
MSAVRCKLSLATLFDLAILIAIAAFTLFHLRPDLILLDTMTVGGDTPAHNYMASHLRDTFFHHGRIVSWAPGWWAGFPLFQYYFYLPYLLIAAVSHAIPFNIAFKLINVLGILALPAAAYSTARLMRLPRPTPILLAIAMLPFLFTRAHTMWGVNTYSTLAGMIANSLSFPIMLLTIGSAYRDGRDGHPRWRSTAFAFLLLSSHFFTTIMAGITLAALPLLLPSGERIRALRTLAITGLRTFLLMAWWLIPLVAKRDFSVDFGNNWAITLAGTLPRYVLALIPFALIAILTDRRTPHRPAILLLAWMYLSAAGLFRFGFDLTPVFVNVRLWPFIWFGLIALAAVGLGRLIRNRPAPWLGLLALLATALVYVTGEERIAHNGISTLRDWATFNYGGLERRPGYPAFRELILPLDGTPGRLANDLAEENNAMGSSRFIEAVPHLINKPILEGGLVNSGLSSYFAYYIQCEMSENCAGFPTIVNPTTFNLVNGTRHLELFNVKHFLARWPTVQQALAQSPFWRRRGSADDWQLFELITHEGNHVYIPKFEPTAVDTVRWREYALEWFYTPELIDQPFIFAAFNRLQRTDIPLESPAIFRQRLTQARGHTGDIDEWLHLGPFPYPPNLESPLAFAPIPETGHDPLPGDVLAGQTWQLLFTRSPIFPGRFYPRTEYLVAYSFVNIHAPTARDAILHYGNDDGMAMWLNDAPIMRDAITGLGKFRTCPITLNAGRNRLLHKTQQSVGGQFFHVRLTDTNGIPFDDVTVSAERQAPAATPPAPRPIRQTGRGVTAETVTSDRIRFTTDAIGLPHIIKCSYFPNWKVRGAKAVYQVSPAFMLVYPDQADVEIYWGRTTIDKLALALTALGWLWLLTALTRRFRLRPKHSHP